MFVLPALIMPIADEENAKQHNTSSNAADKLLTASSPFTDLYISWTSWRVYVPRLIYQG